MFSKNIEAVRAKNPELAARIEAVNLDSITDISAVEAESGDLVIGYKGVALHSLVDPMREANALWNQTVKTDLKKNDIQIVFGLGLGYLFKRAFVNAHSKVVLVEPFVEILRFVLEHVDLSAELLNERVYITDNENDVIDKINKEFLQGDKAEFIYLPAYSNLAQETVENLTQRLVKAIQSKSTDINTIFNFAPIWMRNFILNLPYASVARPLGFFKDKFADKTALLVSAGPSLMENLKKIKQNRDKFVVIAAGKTLKVLVENDIYPDFATFADARCFNSQLKGFEGSFEKINMIVTSRTDNQVLQLDAKSKIYYLPETDIFSELFKNHCETDPGVYPSAGSVSMINYFIAKALGFSKIAFTGLDLAFVDNKIYATGEELKTNDEGYILMEGQRNPNKKISYAKDLNGQDIPTRDDYLVFIRQFEEILENETSLASLINTSVKGAYVKGMEYMEFDQFMEGLSVQQANVDEIIAAVSSETEKIWISCLQKTFEEVVSYKASIEQVSVDSEQAVSDLQSLLEAVENEQVSEYGDEKLAELRQKFAEIREKIMKNPVLQTILQGVLWEYAKNYDTNNIMNKDVIIYNFKQDKKLFEETQDFALRALSFMNKAAEQMAEKMPV